MNGSTAIDFSEISVAAGAAGAAIYNDLGTGTSYGSGLLTKNLNVAGQNKLSIFFNQDGVDAVNTALDPFGTSLFAVGGAFQDLPPTTKQANQYVFQRTWKDDVLVLTVTYNVDPPGAAPEPGTLAMMGFAFLIAASLRRWFGSWWRATALADIPILPTEPRLCRRGHALRLQ